MTQGKNNEVVVDLKQDKDIKDKKSYENFKKESFSCSTFDSKCFMADCLHVIQFCQGCCS